MGNPRLEIDLTKIRNNARQLVDRAAHKGVGIVGVTKVCCGSPPVARVLKEAGVSMIGDSRLENIDRMRQAGIQGPFILIRLPMLSQADEVVRLAEYSLVSELDTIRALGAAAIRAGRLHRVIVMVDVGDLREGVWPDAVHDLIARTVHINGIEIAGLGTNLTCYGAISPSQENLGLLIRLAEELRHDFGLELPLISGGNSSSLGMLWDESLTPGITQLRLGEGIMLGCETLERRNLPGLYTDAFVAVAEAIEVSLKPSVPIGTVAQDVFGNVPVFEDRGIHQRVILGIGRQDTMPDGLVPLDSGVTFLGASSDHMIVEVTGRTTRVGEEFRFSPGYGALLALNTSPYVSKIHRDDSPETR